jgi:polyisoprenoid-binding protein YceI
MTQKKLIVALLAVCSTQASAVEETFTIDPNHTKPVFEVNHLGFSTQRGRFNETTGVITLDRDQHRGSVNFVIKTDSIDMGFQKWDDHMKSDTFFNVVKYPEVVFKSNEFVFQGDLPIEAKGSLTLLGVTRPVSLKIQGFNCGEHPILKKPLCAANIETTIKRSEFGLTQYLPGVGDEVHVLVPVEAFKNTH